MTCPDNAHEVNCLLADVNHAYDSFTFLCTHLSSSDVILGRTDSKLDFDTGYGEFKQRVQQWSHSLKVQPSSQEKMPPKLVMLSQTPTINYKGLILLKMRNLG